jgi:FKBP-type peptidyl-prolyl cis-trans isomerase FklB
MKLIYVLLIASITSMSVQAQKSTLDSVSYALGILVAKNLKAGGFDKLNTAEFARGIDESLGNTCKMTDDQATQVYGRYTKELAERKKVENDGIGLKFLAENKKKKGVTTTTSGLQYEVIKEGTGPKPALTDEVTTHYHGTLISGKVFDSSVDRKEPASFPLNGVIKGWQEGLQLMNTGSKYRFYVPSELAYGDRGAGADIGPGTTLIFEVELISIKGK